ncbi:hypothetical protein FA13DRAFT_1722189 [Coprinellus micaceus]|uniref:Uncharacterized protein n=1 Tax=Coprinellus micaceus TaxID=71717 RepID=A0A4Y7RPS4_COPMI|nr:hypothetical protein FA13DRAFT_1722189 [Coprinellus micaceus]
MALVGRKEVQSPTSPEPIVDGLYQHQSAKRNGREPQRPSSMSLHVLVGRNVDGDQSPSPMFTGYTAQRNSRQWFWWSAVDRSRSLALPIDDGPSTTQHAVIYLVTDLVDEYEVPIVDAPRFRPLLVPERRISVVEYPWLFDDGFLALVHSSGEESTRVPDHRRCLFANWCAEASIALWVAEPITDVRWVDYPVNIRWLTRVSAILPTRLQRAIVDWSVQAGGQNGRHQVHRRRVPGRHTSTMDLVNECESSTARTDESSSSSAMPTSPWRGTDENWWLNAGYAPTRPLCAPSMASHTSQWRAIDDGLGLSSIPLHWLVLRVKGEDFGTQGSDPGAKKVRTLGKALADPGLLVRSLEENGVTEAQHWADMGSRMTDQKMDKITMFSPPDTMDQGLAEESCSRWTRRKHGNPGLPRFRPLDTMEQGLAEESCSRLEAHKHGNPGLPHFRPLDTRDQGLAEESCSRLEAHKHGNPGLPCFHPPTPWIRAWQRSRAPAWRLTNMVIQDYHVFTPRHHGSGPGGGVVLPPGGSQTWAWQRSRAPAGLAANMVIQDYHVFAHSTPGTRAWRRSRAPAWRLTNMVIQDYHVFTPRHHGSGPGRGVVLPPGGSQTW